MTNEIGENFMFYDTIKEIWDAVKETYSNVDNTSTLFEIIIYFMIFDKDIPLSLSILAYSVDIGSSWMCMKK